MAIVNEHMTLETKEDEKEFSKNFSKLKKKGKKNAVQKKILKAVESSKEKPENGSVYVGHIPHGFYEQQLTGYFKQFGKVSNVHLCRSKKTGKSKGYAFVEFKDSRVAKIAAQTMNNYLMCGRRVVASFVPSDGKTNKQKHKNFTITEQKFPMKLIRSQVNSQKNLNLSVSDHRSMCKRYVAHVKSTLMKLKELGIHYEFKPVEDDYNLYASYNPHGKPKVKQVVIPKDQKVVTKVAKSVNSKVKAILKKKNVIKRKQ